MNLHVHIYCYGRTVCKAQRKLKRAHIQEQFNKHLYNYIDVSGPMSISVHAYRFSASNMFEVEPLLLF